MQAQSAKLKKTFISGWERESAEWIEKGMEKGHGLKELAIIRKGWGKGLTAKYIAEFGDIPIKKVKMEIARLEKEKTPGKK